MSIENEPDFLFLTEPEPDIAPIHLCSTHQAEFDFNLDGKDDNTRFYCFQMLIRMATRVMTTQVLIRHKCPLCAFKQHDFIAPVVKYFAEEFH